MGQSTNFFHDLLNKIGAAKMNAELALRTKELPEPARKNLERILSNLISAQEQITFEQDPKVTPAPKISVTTENRRQASETSQKTILLIDDSEDMRSLFQIVLKPKGYEVSVAKNKAEAFQALEKNAVPDLILLDFSLGDETAFDILDELEITKARAINESKIVLFTGHGDLVSDPRVFAIEQKAMDIASMIKLVQKYI